MVLEFWNIKDLMGVVYDADGTQFKQKLYLPEVVDLKNKFETVEDGKKRDGKFIAKEIITSKIYKFTFNCPEYLCDIFNTLRQHDVVQVTFNGGVTATVEDVSFEIVKHIGGGLKNITLSLVLEYIVKNNRDTNMPRS